MKNIKQVTIAVLLCVFSVYIMSFCLPLITVHAVSQKGWAKENGNWYYYDELSGVKKIGWLKSGSKWYFMRGDGSMATGWVKDNNKWYYLKDSGELETGWLKFNNNWYYLYQDGSVATNTVVDSYTIGIDGTIVGATNSESLDTIRKRWEGSWSLINDTIHSSSSVAIHDSNLFGFKFEILAFNGANTGKIEGIAVIDGNTAKYTDNDLSYSVSFNIANEELNIELQPGHYAVVGNGVSIDGKYSRGTQEKKTPSLTSLGVLKTQEQEESFKQLVKDDYKLFIEYFHLISEAEDLDNLGAVVHTGGVRGVFTFCEGIVMVNENKIWAAILDNNEVRYYTNTSDTSKLPKTIDNWRSRFKDAKIAYMGNNPSKKKAYTGLWHVTEAYKVNPSKNTKEKLEVSIEIECKDSENTLIARNKDNVQTIKYEEKVQSDGAIILMISETQQLYYASDLDTLSLITDLGNGDYEAVIFKRAQ